MNGGNDCELKAQQEGMEGMEGGGEGRGGEGGLAARGRD